ncbi:kinase-like domain-containing protein [Lasiosphaeria miniovina]|uniref:Kinase-like domain-containing protein n=1 Tax=Lasiosphaeria miniovina TaxID=1954250 RepID=A0AA40DJI3_9PEZI|nr:kinase-like domain-containing protein [Lasiosphaeria miniovina]KAK0705919.1 kinase-like domain-containing protein [Lasiosphaeria miniovina]
MARVVTLAERGRVLRRPDVRWHVTVTFQDAPKVPEGTPSSQQRRDLEDLCLCIDFDRVPLSRDTVTELILSTKGNAALPMKAEPDTNSLYASIAGNLRFYTREDPLRQEIAPGICVVRISGDERLYVYKEVDRPQYQPEDSEILQRELRNLEQLPHSEEIVRLVATVSSINPYRTAVADADSSGASFLRGFLLEYHPNGTLRDALRSTDSEAVWPWRRWALQIAYGLNHLHCHNVTHLDLKSSNIVISENSNAILIDIGGGGYTREWLAPNMIGVSNPMWEPFEAWVKNDIWAFGMILSEMASASYDITEQKLLNDVASRTASRTSHPIPLNQAISLLE